ncbi:hypothetical protein LTR48_005756 [Friedmanniomyces endolithicus]|uniref:Nitrate reductase [NADPH] n=1 Tax=Rachicladosporium monterosium TaxID=1507873 RepID=A0ABR0L180_9PEZI|nr:hypothetical protein LTR48_005756 [Friedmanniomyces endolithicus]KAK5141874.1 hypothetical protein LTR32_005667 [Rachicladosporium monterosium]
MGIVFIAAGLAYGLLAPAPPVLAESPDELPPNQRLIRLDEIHEHNRTADTYWVFRGDKVYDITDWVPNHPGGEVILRAAGGSLEPYWNIFTIHQKQEVYDVLEHITATLQCSGNRRSHMTQASRPTVGLQWGVGAIGTATWTGVRLRDVLADAGLDLQDPDEDIKHLKFVGAEAYGASIPIDKAIDRHGDVLLAFSMNGQPLPRDHGFPLRVLVPGHVAARSVKWLSKIVISDEESTSQWQRRDYKCFGPNVRASHPDWDSAPAIQETPVQSAITSVRRVQADKLLDSALARVYGLEEDSVVLEGYAFAGGGRHIVRVDISPDRGHTWLQAQLQDDGAKMGASGSPDDHRAWAWRQWRAAVPATQVSGKFCVKATDDSYNVQPDTFEPTYNFRGNLANAWHRVPVIRDDKPS